MKSEFIYHILIDRFTGDPGKYPSRGFTGGTLRGILERLDYIQALGATGIMLTPFHKTAAYHGYHITDYDEVDPHFGTWEDVDALVAEVHRRGMTIVADFVANHCHESHPLFADGRHADWFLHKKDGRVKGFAGLGFLPMFNTDHPEVRDYLTARGLELCRRGFDALRLDHATGPSYAFWKHFRTTLKAAYPQVQLIGEVWGELDFKPYDKKRYKHHLKMFAPQEARQLEYVNILDGVFDFRLREILCRTAKLKNSRFTNNHSLQKMVNRHFERYPPNFALWLFLDNHDTDRFGYVCKGNKEKVCQALAFLQRQGSPCLMYYGTEIGMQNSHHVTPKTPYSDEEVRECMIWS